MTNEEKKEYVNEMMALSSKFFGNPSDLEHIHSTKIPNSLFKYRKFDKYTFEMIDEKYVYLSCAKDLDDSFECLSSIELEGIYEKNGSTLTDEMMNYVFDVVLNFVKNDEKRDEIKNIYLSSIDSNGDFNNSKALQLIMNNKTNITDDEKRIVLNTFANFIPIIIEYINDGGMKIAINGLINAPEITGICSLAESNDNKAMWSQYADKCKGYCVEYSINGDERLEKNLYPVLYEENPENNIVKLIVSFTLNSLIRSLSEGKIKTDMTQMCGVFIKKDKSWETQKEWRILGDAKTKFPSPKINAIYLGYNVSEEQTEIMKERAIKLKFNLYKMNDFKNKTKISFTKII